MAGGRPQADIDWKKVDDLLTSGCSGNQIAGFLGINHHTLYDRCLTDNKIMFSEYSQQKKQKGESLIKHKQYQVAMSGNTTMLIWLGKIICGQTDTDQKITQHFHLQEIDPTNGSIINTNTNTLSVSVPPVSVRSVESPKDGD